MNLSTRPFEQEHEHRYAEHEQEENGMGFVFNVRTPGISYARASNNETK